MEWVGEPRLPKLSYVVLVMWRLAETKKNIKVSNKKIRKA
jgi:hypothetical protein